MCSAINTTGCYPGGHPLVILHRTTNHPPTNISLSNSTVGAGQPSGTPVGNLSTTDPDAGDTHTYSLVAGTGSTDNSSFQIVGSQLRTHAVLSAGSKHIRIRTNDGHGGTYEKQFTITVTPPGNHAPTDIQLSNSSVPEGQPSGTPVGNLSSTDADAGDTFTYTLVAGSGSTDNASFQIVGSQLRTHAVLSAGSKHIRIRTTDNHGGTFEKQFTITVTPPGNHAPTDIGLSNQSVAENQPSGTTVGDLSSTDADAGDTFTYSLVSGTGSADNTSFHISGDHLQTSASFDFETKSSYSVRIQTSDGHGGTFEKQFTITVTNANEAPTDIALSSSTVAENQPSGTTVGTFSTTDPDSGARSRTRSPRARATATTAPSRSRATS